MPEPFDLERRNFVSTCRGVACFSKKNLDLILARRIRNSNQILYMSIRLHVRKIFTRSTMNADARYILIVIRVTLCQGRF